MLAKTAALASGLAAVLVACSSFSASDPGPEPDAAVEASIADAGSEHAPSPTDAADAADAADTAEVDAGYPGCLGAVDCGRTVFLTSSLVIGGSINGVSGGDTLCTQLAAAPTAHPNVRGRVFAAWLSVAGQPATSKLVHGTKPYTLPNGTVLGADWGEFAFHMHEAPLSIDERGLPTADNELRVWTGTNDDGTAAGANCGAWADTTTGGQTGSRAVLEKWSTQDNASCNVPLHLFCVER